MRATVVPALRHTAALFGAHRKLWIPFLLAAGVEATLIGLLWLAPHPPFSHVLAPPLRHLFTDRVLHYPAHLWFLYHAMKHTHAVAAFLGGAFLSGVACVMVRQIHEGKPLSLREALVSGQARYGTLLAVWGASWLAARALMQALAAAGPNGAEGFWWSVGFTAVLQALVVYAIPAAVSARSSWWKAMLLSARETIRFPLSTAALVAVSSLVLVSWALLAPSDRVAAWMMRATPEIVLPLMAARLLVWTVVDAFLTVGIAHLWWLRRSPQPAPALVPAPGPGRLPKTAIAVGLLAVVTAAGLTGCSASYQGERLFWNAQQLVAPVQAHPESASAEQVQAALDAFGAVIARVPETIWAVRAQAAVGSLHTLRHDNARAREAYQLLLQNYSQHQEFSLLARYAIAKSYEEESAWDAAAEAYAQLAEYHPWTRPGLEAPLYVAALHQRQHDPASARRAYERAANTYTKLMPLAPSAELVTQLKGYLAVAYQQLGRWEQALKLLEELAAAPGGINRPLLLLTLGTMYHQHAGDVQKAQTMYTALLQEFPDHPLGKAAKARLERMRLPAALTPSATRP